MARKVVQNTPDSVRIRENQKRSRARRKDLLESLQARVKEYELSGVKATHEMQLAARRVALENERLRSLLALRGVMREEVDAFLRSFGDAGTASQRGNAGMETPVSQLGSPVEMGSHPATHTGLSPNTAAMEAASYHPQQTFEQSRRAVLEEQPDLGPPSSHCQENIPSTRQPEHTNPPGNSTSTAEYSSAPCRGSAARNGLQDATGESSANDSTTTETEDPCSKDPDCFCPPMTELKEGLLNPGLETSCETAARIIIEMRGDVDRETVRASLGCRGREECIVKNTTVLQVMGEL